jgi:hypothetical protein
VRFEKARLHRLRKNSLSPLISVSPLILGGAAVYRCDRCSILNAALAAEVAGFAGERLFLQVV